MDFVSSTLDDGMEIDLIAAVIKLAPVFQALIPYDFICGVTDREKTLAAFPPRNPAFKLPSAVGKKIEPGTITYQVLAEGKANSKEYPAEVFGFPLKIIVIPLKNSSNEVIGALTLALDLASITNIKEATQRIVTASQEITAKTEELTATASELAAEFLSVKQAGNQVIEKVDHSDQILQFINSLAVNSNLLGLNAAIEAARAGEQGRGFAVVAEEIRKMATSSESSVKDIKENIGAISDQTKTMLAKINKTADLSSHQAAATEEINCLMEELVGIAEIVDKATKDL